MKCHYGVEIERGKPCPKCGALDQCGFAWQAGYDEATKELRAQLARAEKVIEAALAMSRDAWPMRQVDNQPTRLWSISASTLQAFRDTWAEYDRPSATLDGRDKCED